MTTTRKVNAHSNLGTLQQGDVVLGERTSGTTGLFTVPSLTGVTDGDKGDITVSSSGAVWTIDTPTVATVATDDKVLIKDTSDSDATKYVTAQSIANLAAGGVSSVNGETGAVTLTSDDISTVAQTNKFVTAADITKLGNLSGTNTGDQNLFQTIAVSGQSNVVADSTTDTLTLVAGTNVTITTDATTDSITINSTASGTGDVVGPASATDNAAARFDSTTGKLIQDSLLIIADTTGNISGFEQATASKNMVVGGNATAAGYIDFLEDSDNGTNKITVTAPSSVASDKTITLPDTTGTLYISGGTDVSLADGGTGASLTDPNADRIMFWDDSAGSVDWLTAGSGLSITTTTITAGAPLLTATASSSAQLDFTTNIDSTYDTYLFVGEGLAPVTDAVQFLMRTSTDGGSTFASSSGDYQYGGVSCGRDGPIATVSSSTTATNIFLTNNVGNASGENISFTVEMSKPSAAAPCQFMIKTTCLNSGGNIVFQNMSAARMASADVDAVRFYFSSGNIASGTIRMYGYVK